MKTNFYSEDLKSYKSTLKKKKNLKEKLGKDSNREFTEWKDS